MGNSPRSRLPVAPLPVVPLPVVPLPVVPLPVVPLYNISKLDKRTVNILSIDNRHITNINNVPNMGMTINTIHGHIFENVHVIMPLENPNENSDQKSDLECVVCLDRNINTVIIDCGHACLCVTCLRNVISNGSGDCPKCIKKITRAINIFIEKADDKKETI